MKSKFAAVLNKIFVSISIEGSDETFIIDSFVEVRKARLVRKTLNGSTSYDGYIVSHLYDENTDDFKTPSLNLAIFKTVELLAYQKAENCLDMLDTEQLAVDSGY